MNEQIFSSMAQVLGEQALLYEGLLELSRKKQRVLVQGGIEEFETILEGEQAILWKAGKLEERRTSLQLQLAGELHLSGEDLTMSRLIESLGDPYAAKFKLLQTGLLSILGELRRLNELNTTLIKKSLEYVNAAMDVLTRAGAAATTYSPDGRLQAGKRENRVLNHKM